MKHLRPGVTAVEDVIDPIGRRGSCSAWHGAKLSLTGGTGQRKRRMSPFAFLQNGDTMSVIKFHFGHLTAGEQEYACHSSDLAGKVHELVDELFESDTEHYQVYFRNRENQILTICHSGLMAYDSNQSSDNSVFRRPEARADIYEIATDFVMCTFDWWIDRFSRTSSELAGNPLFAKSKQDNVDYPLHAAAMANDIARIATLLQAGHNVDGVDNKGRTPLVLAAAQGCLQACAFLVDHGANVEAKDDWGNSVLDLAHESPQLVAYLKSVGVK